MDFSYDPLISTGFTKKPSWFVYKVLNLYTNLGITKYNTEHRIKLKNEHVNTTFVKEQTNNNNCTKLNSKSRKQSK